MYSLARLVWEDAAKYESLQSGKEFSKSLKQCFSKLKSLKLRDKTSKSLLQEYCDKEIMRIFQLYADGFDEDDAEDMEKNKEKLIQNQDQLMKAVSKLLNPK